MKKYEQIYSSYIDEVRLMPPGSALPSVRQLMRDFKTSQATICQMLNLLRNDGLIKTNVGTKTVRAGWKRNRLPARVVGKTGFPRTSRGDSNRKTGIALFCRTGYALAYTPGKNRDFHKKFLKFYGYVTMAKCTREKLKNCLRRAPNCIICKGNQTDSNSSKL